MLAISDDPVTRNTMQWVMIGLIGTTASVMALTSLEGLFKFPRLSPIRKTVTVIQFTAGTAVTVAMVYLAVRKYNRNRREPTGYHVHRPKRTLPESHFKGKGRRLVSSTS